MATKKQKNDLLQALKFTPREVEISLYGYGGEIVIGRISEEAYDYWEGREDLADYVYDWGNEVDVPADANFCPDAAWHDIDDICHESGCEAADGSYITVDDCLEGRTVFESSLDLDALDKSGVDTSNHSHVRPGETEPTGTCIFLGQSFEKGTFFSGRVRITQPFDPAKLVISWQDCDGWRIVSGVEYDGEEVDGFDGYSTTGKGTNFQVYQVERDEDEEWDAAEELDKILKDIPVLEGEEIWASEAIDNSQYSPWWPADAKPKRKGVYEVEYVNGSWPWPITAKIEWTGRSWKHDRTGDTEIKQWRGLNYDPTDNG